MMLVLMLILMLVLMPILILVRMPILMLVLMPVLLLILMLVGIDNPNAPPNASPVLGLRVRPAREHHLEPRPTEGQGEEVPPSPQDSEFRASGLRSSGSGLRDGRVRMAVGST
jgi:hypothetical protein